MANVAISSLPTGTATGGEIFVGNQSGTTKALSIGADALSDYTTPLSWTPTFFGDTTAGTPTYTIQLGRAVRIGKMAFCNFHVALSLSGAVGGMEIGGLPFTCATAGGTGSRTSATFSFINGFNLTGIYYLVGGILFNGATQISLQKLGTGNSATLTEGDLSGGNIAMYGSITFETT